MKAGTLRHRVTLQTATTAADAVGQQVKTWADTATVWASVEPLSGRELNLAKQVNAETTAKVTIRYRSGVVPTMRVKFGTRYFQIESVINNFERNIYQDLLCKEVTP